MFLLIDHFKLQLANKNGCEIKKTLCAAGVKRP
jgi:hypothetical protein